MGSAKKPTVVFGLGSENVNQEVNDLLESVDLTRVLAQVELAFSDSMIDVFWRSFKHAWLYLHSLDSITVLHRLIEFPVSSQPIRDSSRETSSLQTARSAI
jgi:hypothetical protein